MQDERVLETGCTTMWIYLTLVNCTLKVVKMVNFILCVSYRNKKKRMRQGLGSLRGNKSTVISGIRAFLQESHPHTIRGMGFRRGPGREGEPRQSKEPAKGPPWEGCEKLCLGSRVLGKDTVGYQGHWGISF